MRRFAPDGVATGIMWTANVRALRHVIEARTAPGAEEEIRIVFSQVAALMLHEAPALFGDFTEHEDGSWVPAGARSSVMAPSPVALANRRIPFATAARWAGVDIPAACRSTD